MYRSFHTAHVRAAVLVLFSPAVLREPRVKYG